MQHFLRKFIKKTKYSFNTYDFREKIGIKTNFKQRTKNICASPIFLLDQTPISLLNCNF